METAANMLPSVQLIALFSLIMLGFNLTVWAVLDKYNAFEKYDVYHERWWKRLPKRTCMLCVAFWMSVPFVLLVAFLAAQWVLLFVPFVVAAPTLKLAMHK